MKTAIAKKLIKINTVKSIPEPVLVTNKHYTDTTRHEYSILQQAYEFFNTKLFHGKLPHVLITLQHGKKYYGYYWAEKFIGRKDDSDIIGEVALNPDLFYKRSDKDILSTLVHEQCHVWQYELGEPGRKGYHNKEWAEQMKLIGLHPSDTGMPGGKETGSKMTHYIIPDGIFDRLCNELITSGFNLNWQSFMEAGKEKAKKKQTRVKYTCPNCNSNVWAKPNLNIMCEDDNGKYAANDTGTESED